MKTSSRLFFRGRPNEGITEWTQAPPLVVPTGHNEPALRVAGAPDGRFVATACENIVKLWNREGQELLKLAGHTHPIDDLAFSPDGALVLTCGEDTSARVWTLTGRELFHIQLLNDEQSIETVTWSADSRAIFTAHYDGQVRMWGLDGRKIRAFHSAAREAIDAVACSPTAQLIAGGDRDGTIWLWEIGGSLVRTFPAHTGGIDALTFSPDGALFATAGADGVIYLATSEGRTVRTIRYRGREDHALVRFSPDGKQLLTSVKGIITLHELDGSGEAELPTQARWLSAADFSPLPLPPPPAASQEAELERCLADLTKRSTAMIMGRRLPTDQYLALATDEGAPILRNRRDGDIVVLRGHRAGVSALAFSPDGEHVLSGSEDHTARYWDHEGKCIHRLEGHTDELTAAVFSPDGARIATASIDGTVKLWRTKTGEEVATLYPIDREDWVVMAADGRFDATSGALKRIYYVFGGEVIGLDVLAPEQFVLGLLPELLRSGRPAAASGEPVALKTRIDGQKLIVKPVRGKLRLAINECEVAMQVEPEEIGRVEIALGEFGVYWREDGVNTVVVKIVEGE
jgi:WD40 repeat protein